MIIDMSYCYKGSYNTYLKLIERACGIELVTEYGETITTVTTGYMLMRVLENLYNEEYA